MIVFLHAALFVVLSSFRPTSCLSCILPSLLFPGVSTSNILLTMCSSFILLTCPYHFSRLSVIFLDACTTIVCCSSNVFISDLDFPCHFAHPSQHPVYNRAVWSDHSFVYFFSSKVWSDQLSRLCHKLFTWRAFCFQSSSSGSSRRRSLRKLLAIVT